MFLPFYSCKITHPFRCWNHVKPNKQTTNSKLMLDMVLYPMAFKGYRNNPMHILPQKQVVNKNLEEVRFLTPVNRFNTSQYNIYISQGHQAITTEHGPGLTPI